ncbi:MAG: hypothetical protein V4632_17775 [Pseudomonadota bacterium]
MKLFLFIAAILGFIVLSHMALVAEDASNIWRQIAVVLVLVPVIAIVSWGAWILLGALNIGFTTKLICLAAVVLLALYAAVLSWPNMLTRLEWVYLAQHVGTNTMLGWFFGHTLFQNRVPLITTFARTLHGDLPAAIVRYTRGATLGWTLFFAAQVTLSLLIFYFASTETWSLFANVLNWPLVVLMFAGEFICRKRMNPDFHHATIKESVTAYFNSRNKQ